MYSSPRSSYVDMDCVCSLDGLIRQLEAIRDDVRADRATDATVRIDGDGDIDIAWTRPETADERDARRLRERQEQIRQRDRDTARRNTRLQALRDEAIALNVYVDFTKGNQLK